MFKMHSVISTILFLFLIASAAFAQQNQGLPLWYGWGAGPVAWPTGPIVVPPIVTNRPAPR